MQESWHTNDFSKQNAHYFDPGCHLRHSALRDDLRFRSGGITHEDLRWHLHLFAIAIDRFLTHNTKECPRDRRKPLWLDILFTLFADAERAFTDAAQNSPSVSQLLRFAVDVTDCEITFGSALNFVYLIRTLFNCNAVAPPDPSLQLSDARFQNTLESGQVVFRR